MFKRFTVGIVGIVGILIALVAVTGRPAAPAYDPYQLDRQRLAWQQQQAEAARAESRSEFIEPYLKILLAALALAPVAGLVIAIDRYRLSRRLVTTDHAGRVALPRQLIESDPTIAAAALGAYHQTQLELARAQQRPAPVAVPVNVPSSAPALLPAPASTPTLPDSIALADVIDGVPRGSLAFGMLPGGQLLHLPFSRAYHALAAGDTRSGKTNMLDTLIVQLHRMARLGMPLTLYGADIKQELQSTWGRSTLFVGGIQSQPAEIAELLAELVKGADGVQARYSLFAATGQEHNRVVRNLSEYASVTGKPPRLAVLIVDELNALLTSAGKSAPVADNLKTLLQLGAGAGIYVLGGAQYLDAATLGRSGSKQFTSRAMLGAYDPTAARMIFGVSIEDESRALLTGGQGRGLIRTNTQPAPVPFQAPLCSEGDILECLPATNAGTATPGERAAMEHCYSPLARSETALQPVAAEMPKSAPIVLQKAATGVAVSAKERAAILAAAAQVDPTTGQPLSRSKVCMQVFGVRGGQDYKKVQTVLDNPSSDAL